MRTEADMGLKKVVKKARYCRHITVSRMKDRQELMETTDHAQQPITRRLICCFSEPITQNDIYIYADANGPDKASWKSGLC